MRPSARNAVGVWAGCDGGLQERAAGRDFRRRRLVLRRHAPHPVDDQRAGELQGIVGPCFELAGGKAELLQRGEQQVTGVVAGERAPGPDWRPSAPAPARRSAAGQRGSPQLGTGALNQSEYSRWFCRRNSTSRGHSGQSCGGSAGKAGASCSGTIVTPRRSSDARPALRVRLSWPGRRLRGRNPPADAGRLRSSGSGWSASRRR